MKTLLALTLSLFASTALAQQFPSTNPFGPGVAPVCVSTAAEGSHVCKTFAGNLFEFQATNTNASARWILVYDAVVAPGDGASTPKRFYEIGGNSTLGVSWGGGPPLAFTTGIVLVCSTTGPFTKTATADCVFSGTVQ